MASAETNTSEQSSSVGSALFQNIENSEMSNGARPSAACITEIDISAPARALGVLRWSDYLLVVGCGYSALWMLFDLVTSPINSEWAKIVLEVPVVGVLAFAAFTGWRHLGVIDPRVWRSYLYVFPLLTAFALLMTYAVATTWMSRSKPLEDIESMLAMSGSLWFLGIAIPGFISLLVLRRVRITAVGKRLDDLLNDLTCQSGHSALNLTEIKRIDIHRGLAFIILGAALLLIGMFLPSPAERTIDDRFAGSLAQLSQWLTIVAFFSIIRARRYFQVSADHLLAVDKRPPILFLRSFSDENPLTGIYRAIVDFSLETRLANHFYRFGPFIAVGSPKELLPLPGAARVILPDSEWQARVLSWIKEANLIVMYLGTTEWVNWELRKIVEQGRATSLILMFPEVKGWRPYPQRDILARIEHIREVYKDTPWNEELMENCDFACLRAMLFRPDGSMVMIKSRSRSRDSYHLAALVAHHQLLSPVSAPSITITHMDKKERRWATALAWTLSGVLALGAGLYWLTSDHETKLTFKQGQLYYAEPVSQTEASGVGEYLVRQHYFSDERGVTVKLSQEQGRYRLGFVVDPTHAEKLLPAIQFGVLGSDIGREVLSGKPIEVELYDPNLKLIKTLPWSAKLLYGKGELYYTDPISLSEAQALGEWLKQNGFFTETQASAVHFGREQGVYQLRFVIDPSRLADPQIIGAFIEFSRAIAEQVLGGSALLVHLCDQEFHTLKSERVEPISAVQHQLPSR